MGRAPCCEKMGLKKGPWTPDEDQILITYIRLHGHSNWRALPKQAGLLRCGKSCRLRWTNYLRPDIKRGNFSQDEEETIIKLHEMLGNRWSAIAAKLPGRTDNEIKNVWHTHLKKRLPKQNEQPETASTTTPTPTVKGPTKKRARKSRASKKTDLLEEPESKPRTNNINNNNNNKNKSKNKDEDNVRPTSLIKCEPVSPQPCTSEVSTITTSTSASENDNFCKENVGEKEEKGDDFTEINDDFWKEVLFIDDTAVSTQDLDSISPCHMIEDPVCVSESKVNSEEMDFFWYNLLTRSDDLPEFSEIM